MKSDQITPEAVTAVIEVLRAAQAGVVELMESVCFTKTQGI
jgi:hypothetical protein